MASDEASSSAMTPTATGTTPDSESEEHAPLSDSLSSPAIEKGQLRRLHGFHVHGTDLPMSSEDSESENDWNGTHIQQLKRVSTKSTQYTDEEEAAVLRKFDTRLVLFLALLYMLSFLDRSNIGNARVAGLEDSLGISSNQYEWILTTFYITYIVFEWMILLYKVVPPHIYISLCVLSWGIVASMQSVTTSFSQLLVLRGLLGVSEAAFGPGVPFYMSFFYRRSELAYRVGLQISAAPLATSFAATLAWVIIKTSKYGPLEPWRALFLIEGFPSVIVAIIAWYVIPDGPATARYLTTRERRVAKLRMQDEQTRSSQMSDSGRGVNLSELFTTLRDPKAYLTALMFFSVNVAFSSMPVFLPTIIHDMAFSELASQALSAPPFLVAFGFVLLIGHLSDKHPDSRSYYIIAVSLLSSVSYAAMAVAGLLHTQIGDSGTITIRYLAVFGANMGFFSAVTLIITWTLNNQQSATGKGTGMTILNVIGQLGPLVGVRLYPKTQAPFYIRGMAICAGFMLGVAVLAMCLRWHLQRLNRKEEESSEYEMVEVGREANETLMGPGRRKTRGQTVFRFML